MPLSNVAHNPQAVWEALQAGNQRVIDGTIMDLNKIYEREGLTKGQDPRVVVLACSDSRAPIEHIFNIGFGDAFVIRTAGHILDASVLASLDYALDHLHPNLLVVLGHQSCGAVAAAVDFVHGAKLPIGLQRPIIEKVATSALTAGPDATLADVERKHTLQTVTQVVASIPNVRKQLDDGSLGIVGARYLLEDSRVEPLHSHGVELTRGARLADPGASTT
ncbi:carbonic anhydrase [Corynebacterium accolens]|uniref:carbonic anhydrase n=1 Tax=Corynebacterium accolens TaxID=38284 RepID=UPI002542D08C|nr:carbonic anhydrase [Corynebacterium accolens]MDK4233431.1 carbonic anhydrase [Corynebacterium accolens]MDK4274907.1 carbonic anhydrase [Corynebacterium accolens]MDK4280095.1 carbonic anhydrase [Corynebacterium accolens]MDK4294354.1 carbonic anhydrase [Corynebacterium accolens]MDK4332859.1 carbonic anhydrase [Corynebacterium accolens]